ncbi:unnamed protein product [Aphis gossypii]|uniref:C2H2-type domain-containing protein n=1 Tax=Aphis gossypii TaxID=80765 RepID=A0A9P0IZD5_APHGO|nr:unnamed protein product [Aphis gossypii]
MDVSRPAQTQTSMASTKHEDVHKAIVDGPNLKSSVTEENGNQGNNSSHVSNVSDESSETDDDYDILKYKCDQCNLEFLYKSWFLRHKAIHNPATFTCNYCPKKFKRKDGLKEHTFYHIGRAKFKCDICSNLFSDRRNLNSHIKSKHIGNLLSCPNCSKQYNGKRQLRYHIQRMHEKINKYFCECNAGFTVPSLLFKHRIKMNHKKPEVTKEPKENGNQDNNSSHVSNVSDESSETDDDYDILKYKCDQCNLEFLYKSWFLRHKAIHNPATFTCNYCPKKFKRKDGLKEHTFYHIGRAKFKCDICSNLFSDRRNLNSHIKSKHIGNLLSCPNCSKQYNGKRQLRYHIQRMHEKINKYFCECNAGFTVPSLLFKHRIKMDHKKP